MIQLALPQQSCPVGNERHPWTAEDSRDLRLFAAHCLGIVGAAMLLYLAGPALGLTLVAATLAAWAGLRRAADAKREAASAQANGTRDCRGNLW